MTKRKKAVKWNLRTRIRSALRKVWQWSPARRQALADARVSYGRYKCATCGDHFGPRHIKVDHCTPATPDHADWTWDEFIERLFCPTEGLQCLCTVCHDIKTRKEREAKKLARGPA